MVGLRSCSSPLLALSLLAASGCAPGGGTPLPKGSAILITLDTTRRDALGCYAGNAAPTPNLDRLAVEGIVYERAYTAVPVTLPSHASMLTGLYPPRHTVRDNGVSPLPQAAETVAERAREAGVETAAFLAAVVLAETFGLDQGFDLYQIPSGTKDESSSHFTERPAREVVDAALGWWDGRDSTRPFFLWVHFFDPHAPYEIHPGTRPGASKREIYQGEVTSMDREIGRLLDRLRRDGGLDAATVVVVGDHGEAFGEHGTFSHATYCYGENVDIPLFVRHPNGRRAGERSDEIVSVVDVAPTLLAAMGLEAPAGIDGLVLGGEPIPPARGVYVESYAGYISYGWSPIAGWIDRRGKYLHSSEPEFYDLVADPRERHNLAGNAGVDERPYTLAILDLTERPVLPTGESGGLDRTLLDRIRGLGYASAGVDVFELPHPLASSALPSPASMASVHTLLQEALTNFNSGRLDAAEEMFTAVLDANPRNLFALDFAATCRMRQGRYAEAIDPLRRLLRVDRPHVKNYFNLGVCLAKLGKRREAIEAFEAARILTPDDPRIQTHLRQLRRQEPGR